MDEIKGKKLILLLDYDGTLTPIVSRPELAVLSDDMRGVLKKTAKKHPLAIISGRSLEDVKKLVDVENIYYAGNHGFEISNNIKKLVDVENMCHIQNHGFEISDEKIVHPEAEKAKPIINKICRKTQKKLSHIKGSIVENKGDTASVHYRMVSDNDFPVLEKIFNEVISFYVNEGKIRITKGKKVFEIRPNIEWDKGKAVKWVMDVLGKKGTPVYIGDDQTDEDAFIALKNKGVTTLVSEKTRSTNAEYYLRNVDEVKKFLESLL